MTESALLICASLTFIASLILCGLCRAWAIHKNFVDTPGSEEHKQQAHAVPYGGGTAVCISILAGFGIFHFLEDGTDSVLPWQALKCLGIGCLSLFLLGLYDDKKPLPAWLKLTGQIAIIAVALSFAQVRIDSLQEFPLLAWAAALLWCLIITNAYNFLDHADGLSSSVAIISLGVLIFAAQQNQDFAFMSLLILCTCGLFGFLCWNFPPAKLYLGDSGSLPLGFLLGAAPLLVTFWQSGNIADSVHSTQSNMAGLLAPILISALLLYDVIIVFIKRIRRGLPLFKGDRRHISHRLSRLGLGPRLGLLCIIALHAALSASALLLQQASGISTLIICCQAGFLCLALALLEADRDDQ